MDAPEALLAAVEAELEIAMGSAETVAADCAELARILGGAPQVLRSSALTRLCAPLGRRAGATATALFGFLESQASTLEDPAALVAGLLGASDASLRVRAAQLAGRLASKGELRGDVPLLSALAAADARNPFTPAALAALAPLEAHPLERAARGEPRELRRLAARLLDGVGERLTPERARAILGEDAATLLMPYLEYTGAGFTDLVELVPRPGEPPRFLESFRGAERVLGAALLREVVGKLGWPRLTYGLVAEPLVGVAVGGSFPLVVPPAMVELLPVELGATEVWRRFVVIAHGGPIGEAEEQTPDAAVQRFRSYNVAHAELLELILAVAPLDHAKARRILELLTRVVADFQALFTGLSDDATRVAEVFVRMRDQSLRDLEAEQGRAVLSPETVRRLQMFEEARSLDDVTTLHGLKRYLHQAGLRLAFRLFRSSREANRTVDLLVASEHEVLHTAAVIRYLEFEPTEAVGPAGLPFVVSLLAHAFSRQLLHGRAKLPGVAVLGYGNELQVYANYRNHPAFLRIDLSPPQRGGMIDLEYFAVSQYELDQHPDLSLPSIQRLLRYLEFDVQKDQMRLHVRYDKERAFDRADLVDKVRVLFDLLPYLMELDWWVGDLDYSPAVRAEVANAWARFFAAFGVVPATEVLAEGRRKILTGWDSDAAGTRQLTWDGREGYRDIFAGTPPAGLPEAVRTALEARGLGQLATWAWASGRGFGQRVLDACVVGPLGEALERGELRAEAGHLTPAPATLFAREHEAARLAALLAAGPAELAAAAQTAAVVRAAERQLRFRLTGTVQSRAVQAAVLPTAPRPIGVYVLRDDAGVARLALASRGAVLYRSRVTEAEPWRESPVLEAAELVRVLRAANYVGAGEGLAAPPPDDELERLRLLLRTPSASPCPRPSTEDRVVPGVVAAPGRATGFARFHGANWRPAELDGAVMVAPAVRPEDAPWLRHAAALVSTGGGALSHIGLVALELGKPAVIVEGRWSKRPSGADVLLYRRPQCREEVSDVDGLEVIGRHDLREVDESLEDGDVLTVDADGGSVVVLGRDPQALALHQDLHQLEEAAAALDAGLSEGESLAARGRLLRAVHQLERLLGRLDRAALARHAVQELLGAGRGAGPGAGRQGRRQLLGALLRNAAVAAETRSAVQRRLEELRARLESQSRAAQAAVPLLVNPAEVILTRIGVLRLRELVLEAIELATACGQPVATLPPASEVEDVCRARLEALGRELDARLRAVRSEAGQGWRLRHLLRRAEELRLAFGTAPVYAALERALERSDADRLDTLGGRVVVGMADAGVELAPLVGNKAANLGELGRALGPERVPAWFAVTDAAFRQVMRSSPRTSSVEGLPAGPAPQDLGEAIALVARSDWDSRRKADAIRRLWLAAPLPPALCEQVAAAYRALGRVDEEPSVAVRSSTHEEDAEGGAWAGQFDTFLFVRGAGSVLEHLRLAWAGFWTARAIDERRALGMDELAVGGGIVVQCMVDARVSGVLHTVSAATGQLREMVINVGLGLGEGVVSGTVEVDQVLVTKGPGIAAGELELRYRVGDKREQVVWDREHGGGTRRRETLYHQRLRPALEYVEVLELVRAAARLEEVFLEPLDLEFAIEGSALHIVQVRPIGIFQAAWRETLARHALGPDPDQVREVRP